MATASSTGLVQNTDFSAELLLNKVMNKQLKTQNGNTITLTGRMNASKLDAQAQSYGVLAENVAKGATIATATQNALTEMLSLAKKAQEANVMTDTDQMKKLGKELQNQYSALISTQVEGVSVLQGSTAFDLGLGSGNLTLGLGNNSSFLSSLNTALGSISGGSSASNLDTIVNDLYGLLSVEGTKADLVNNRYDAINDLVSSYKTASDNQVVTEGGSATSLLNSLL